MCEPAPQRVGHKQGKPASNAQYKCEPSLIAKCKKKSTKAAYIQYFSHDRFALK